MKALFIAALAVIVIANQARSEEKCLFEPTKPVVETTCLHIELLPPDEPTTRTIVPVDPARVAAMIALPQVDTIVKEVAAD